MNFAPLIVYVEQVLRLSIVYIMHVRSWIPMDGCIHAPIRDLTYAALEQKGID